MFKHMMWTCGLLAMTPLLGAQQSPQKPASGKPAEEKSVADKPASEKPAADKPATPAHQYEALIAEYASAQREFQQAYSKAKTQEERQKVMNEQSPQPQKFAARFLEFAEKNSADPAAIDALLWLVTNVSTSNEGKQALAVMAEKHVDNEKMGQVCQRLAFGTPSLQNEKLLRTVLEKNPHRSAQAQACLALAKVLKQQSEMARSLRDDEALAKRLRQFYGEDYTNHLAKLDPDAASKSAEQMYERVIGDFGDVASGRGTLAEAAKGELFELRNLARGKVAPEIEAEDIDGQTFKLSDYRGKVVVLDFWGHW